MDASINESEDERKYVSLNVMRDGDCAAIVRICDALGNATRWAMRRAWRYCGTCNASRLYFPCPSWRKR